MKKKLGRGISRTALLWSTVTVLLLSAMTVGAMYYNEQLRTQIPAAGTMRPATMSVVTKTIPTPTPTPTSFVLPGANDPRYCVDINCGACGDGLFDLCDAESCSAISPACTYLNYTGVQNPCQINNLRCDNNQGVVDALEEIEKIREEADGLSESAGAPFIALATLTEEAFRLCMANGGTAAVCRETAEKVGCQALQKAIEALLTTASGTGDAGRHVVEASLAVYNAFCSAL